MNRQSWHKFKQLIQSSLDESLSREAQLQLPALLILVEGATEQILLPYFAQICGLDLSKYDAMVIAAGGANQIVRKYSYLRHNFEKPIFCLFDQDAQTFAKNLLSELRNIDNIHILADGEIEDILQLDYFVQCVNDYLAGDLLNDLSKPVLASDFADINKRTTILEKIWRQHELGKFEKIKFAQFIASKECSIMDISDDGKIMFNKLHQLIESIDKKK